MRKKNDVQIPNGTTGLLRQWGHMRTNTGQPVHRTESTKNSGSPVKLSEYSFSNQQQYN